MKDPKYRGMLYAVKVGSAKGSVHDVLSEALVEAFAETLGKRLPDEAADKLSTYLIDEMKIGASAQHNTGERFNSVIRAGNAVGIPMVDELREMLKEAKAKSGENDVARGRMRGLAQAIAYIRSPYSWFEVSNRERLIMIKQEEAR